MSGITILYGSETGNAQDYAELLYKRLQYFQLSPAVSSLDDYPLKQLITHTKVLIVVCSTTGQGELPLNSKKFMKFMLKKKLPADFFSHIYLTLFGVGDSLYLKFNYAIKKIHTRLVQLGCNELSARCEADEQSSEGIDGFYMEWEASVIEALKHHFPDMSALPPTSIIQPEHKVIIDALCETNLNAAESVEFTNRSPDFKAGVVAVNQRLTAEDHFQDVRHIVIESQDAISYLPGDTISLCPVNDDHSVELLLELQPHWLSIADKPLSLTNPETLNSIPGGLVQPLTLKLLIKYHLDIMSIPRRLFFLTLWHFIDGDASEFAAREKEKLFDFSSFEEPEDLYDYANRPRRLILETILEFQTNLTIPIEFVYELFPKIKSRLFLIALKPSTNLVEIVVAIVEYKTILRRIRRGLCTKWLKSKNEGSRIMFGIHKSGLKFPTDSPILMIAPGTGVAPMKSLIEERLSAIENDIPSHQKLALFFGCRFQSKDHIFGEKWEQLSTSHKLDYFPCFSRDSNSTCKYVQDKLIEQSSYVSKLILKENATIFICGSSGAMPRQVKLTLIEICKKHGKLTEEDAQKCFVELEASKRYIQETW